MWQQLRNRDDPDGARSRGDGRSVDRYARLGHVRPEDHVSRQRMRRMCRLISDSLDESLLHVRRATFSFGNLPDGRLFHIIFYS